MKFKRTCLFLATVAAFSTTSSYAATTTVTKSATGTNLANAGSWTGTHDGDDRAVFTNGSLTGALTVDAPVTWKQLWFGTSDATTLSDIGAPISITGSKITLANSGDTDATASNNTLRTIATKAVTIGNDIDFTGTSRNTISIASGGITLNGAINFSGNLNFILRGASGSTGIISGVISTASTGTVQITDATNWTLSGANTYATKTSVSNGSLTINSIKNVGGGASSLGAVTTAANGTIQMGQSGATATLKYTGSGDTTDRVLDLQGATVILDQSGSGLLKFTSDLTSTISGAKTFTLQGSSAGTGEIGGAIVNGSGTTSLTKAGTGIWTLSGANTYTGATTISEGTLNLANTLALQNSTLAYSAGTLVFDSSVVSNAFTFGGLSGTKNIALQNNAGSPAAIALSVGNNNANTSYTGNLSGAGSLAKIGSGTLTLGGNNTATGATSVTAGTLLFAKQVSLYNNNTAGTGWTAANLTVASGATAAFNVGGAGEFTATDIQTIGGLTNVGAATATQGFKNGSILGLDTSNAGGSFTYGSVIANHVGSVTDTLGLAKLGTGTLLLTAANTYTGNTVISGGTLELGTGGSLGSGNYSGVISGTGALTKSGTGTQILTGANTYTGGTSVNAGTLQAGSSGATNGKATLNGGNLTITNGVTYSVDGGLTFASNTNATVAAASGSASLQGFDVQNADIIVNTGVTASINASIGVKTNTYGIRIDNTGDLSIAGIISGAGSVGGGVVNNGTLTGTDQTALYKLGAGTLTLTGASTFTGATGKVGATSVQDGILKLSGGNDRLPAGSAVYLGATTNTSGKLALDGISQTITGLTTIGSGTGNAVVGGNATLSTLTVNNTNDYTFGGKLGGAGANENNLAFNKSGAGTMTLSGTNTYTGTTTIKAGTLALGLNGSLASSTIVVGDAGSSGAVLDATAKSGLTIGAGQTLKGIGTVNVGPSNTLTIAGTHAAGNSVGTESVTGNLSYSAGSIFEWELGTNKDNATGSPGTDFDAVNVTGNLAIDGTAATGALFKVVLGTDFTGADAFWTTTRSWDVFSVAGTSSTVFQNFALYNASNTAASVDYSTYGTFSYGFAGNKGTLTWSAVPEPTSAMAGLLLGAGLLRRRRKN